MTNEGLLAKVECIHFGKGCSFFFFKGNILLTRFYFPSEHLNIPDKIPKPGIFSLGLVPFVRCWMSVWNETLNIDYCISSQ